MIADHLRVPLGLAIDNIRDFILEDPLTLDKEENADIPVAPDFILDWMYETVVLKLPKLVGGKNKTRKSV